MKKRQIWTMGYFPFTIGGSVNQPIVTEIGFIEEKNVGKGFRAFSFKTPNGTLRVAESVTGAIVGDSFENVKEDIKSGSKKDMLKQIEDAKQILKGSCKHLTNEEFFKLYKF